MAELPEGWAAKTSSSTGRTYYLNEYTKATQWEKPEPVPPGQVQCNTSLCNLSYSLGEEANISCVY